jgi:uncharacterized YigZ family protein
LSDQFLTLASPAEGFYMERGSKFLAIACPVQTEEAAQQWLHRIKKDHPKARHYCTALRLGPDASLERSSDDGEPSGSAGRPMLGQLIKYDLTNVFIVVVRYFGGTKLGIPGLIEAYKTSTANAILAGEIVERHVFAKVRIQMAYDSFPHFLNFCKQHSIPVFQETFDDHASLVIGVKKSNPEQEVLQSLQQFSQMDYTGLEAYATHLGMQFSFLNEEEIF